MKPVTNDVYFAVFARGDMKALKATRVPDPRNAVNHPDGFPAISRSAAQVDEWAIDGEIVARKVSACGETLHWLRADIAAIGERHVEADRAETDRMKATVAEMIDADRRRRAEVAARPVPALSPQLIHAAMRHNQRIGRYWDQNVRGAETRARFALLLDHAAVSVEGDDE